MFNLVEVGEAGVYALKQVLESPHRCKQVFHELARHLQTRRLIAGDSISLDQDKSFYCVVDGMVQVFAQTGQPAAGQQGSWDDEDMNGYQLLNEVGSGGTLSSLFTILSLFTEDVKMSWQDGFSDGPLVNSPDLDSGLTMNRPSRANSDIPQLDLEHDTRARSRRSSISSTTSTVHTMHTATATSPGMRPRPAFMAPTPEEDHDIPASSHRNQPEHVESTQIHRGAVARATVDTTLAVIPAEAFRRLTKKFPKATGHIVQG